jgi:phosphoglucomutase
MIRFGTSGWRGVVGQDFTFRNVRLALDATARVLLQRGAVSEVLVSYDTRLLSEKFAQEAVAVFTHHGIATVMSERDLPSPCLAHAVRDRQATLGVMFTASHNPPEYNGIKLFTSDGAFAGHDFTDTIEMEARRQEPSYVDFFVPQRNLASRAPLSEAYLDRLERDIDWEAVARSGLVIAVDPLWGTAREFLDRLLLAHGVTTYVAHATKDPYFGGYSPECSPQNLAGLRELVRAKSATLGLATDGDGDRFGVLDSACRALTPNLAIALLMDYVLRRRRAQGGLGRTLATTRMVDRIAAAYDRELVETPVGFYHFAPDLLSGRLAVAAEESAGLGVGTHLPERDGIYAALLMAEMVAVEGRSLRELVRELSARFGTLFTRRIQLPLPERTKVALGRLSIQGIRELGGRKVVREDRRDGLLLELEGGSWVLARPAGTEPRLRIYAEAASAHELHALLRSARRLVRQAEEEVTHVRD